MLTLASSSRNTLPRLARAASTGGPPVAHAAPNDSKLDMIRATLYPAEGVQPNSASPLGTRHAKYADRLRQILPSEEAHETVERAWALYRRHERAARDRKLRAKYNAMVEACEELDKLTQNGDRSVYDRAMVRMNHGVAAQQIVTAHMGQKKSLRSQWAEARPAGLVPREAWVPTETRGKGWNYAWKRPECEFWALGLC